MAASVWLIYVGHCIVTMWWIPSYKKRNAILQLLQGIAIYVRLLWILCLLALLTLKTLPCLYLVVWILQSLADSCFPINQGPSASRLHGNFLHSKERILNRDFMLLNCHFLSGNSSLWGTIPELLCLSHLCWHSDISLELFLHQFCDAHSCSGKQKPFSRGGKVRLYSATSVNWIVV